MILSATGHRMDKLGGNSIAAQNHVTNFALLMLRTLREETPIEYVISGTAPGWDYAIMVAAKTLKIPFIAAVPFRLQYHGYPKELQSNYHALLAEAQRIEQMPIGISSSREQMNKLRSKWMVDNSDEILALYDNYSRGAAWSCIEYARKVNRRIRNVWKHWLDFQVTSGDEKGESLSCP